jgi:hypothetical protein
MEGSLLDQHAEFDFHSAPLLHIILILNQPVPDLVLSVFWTTFITAAILNLYL